MLKSPVIFYLLTYHIALHLLTTLNSTAKIHNFLYINAHMSDNLIIFRRILHFLATGGQNGVLFCVEPFAMGLEYLHELTCLKYDDHRPKIIRLAKVASEDMAEKQPF